MFFPPHHQCYPQPPHLPALSRRAPSVTDGEREIFTARQALQSKAGDFNAPHGPSLLRHSLKATDVGISDRPHGRSVLAQYSHLHQVLRRPLAIKPFDQLTVVCPKDFYSLTFSYDHFNSLCWLKHYSHPQETQNYLSIFSYMSSLDNFVIHVSIFSACCDSALVIIV